ncbi:MAG TPA: 1-(5-phosphoribosyl)-5-[(5-phosphoribosylamino)methylideneamino]imidazole-4-carboxamide isomerase [Anaerolineae bacterium]|nr:1-(5-phosphoribosyl)-5-[(5-phosphoribosylamino)methylideneamino]imidazole-4-carboxamide isomerase [Anaerolineae bacterium]
MFTIYPAIDLRGGHVVRLKQGRVENEIVFSDDPAQTARHWEREGATWLHIVDLDRAFGDVNSENRDVLQAIRAAVKIPIQLGGGLRDLETMRRALELGVSRLIIGTLAIEKPQVVADALREFGAERIIVAIDTRDGMVATRGWVAQSNVQAQTFGKAMRALGMRRAMVTDIARDGTLQGVDVDAMTRFAEQTSLRVIASGGVASLDDVRNLRRAEPSGIEGVIIGQALYTGAFSLSDAMSET